MWDDQSHQSVCVYRVGQIKWDQLVLLRVFDLNRPYMYKN